MVDPISTAVDVAQGITKPLADSQDVARVQTSAPTYSPEQEELIKSGQTGIAKGVEEQQAGVKGVGETTEKEAKPYAETSKDIALGSNKPGVISPEEAQAQTLKDIQHSYDQADSHLAAAGDAFNKVKEAAIVNPQEVINNFFKKSDGKDSTGKKILFGLGMLLSGIGSGLTGQPNMAQQIFETRLQQGIDNKRKDFQNSFDIAAQEANIGSKFIQSAQGRAMSQQMAAGSSKTLISAVTEALGTNLQSTTAKNNAALLAGKIGLEGSKDLINSANMFKGSYVGSTEQNRSIAAQGLMNLTNNMGGAVRPQMTLHPTAYGGASIPGISAPLINNTQQVQSQPLVPNQPVDNTKVDENSISESLGGKALGAVGEFLKKSQMSKEDLQKYFDERNKRKEEVK